ncbi:hypothetical protein GA0070604_3974 [Micromonospora eburnea]|uniref:Thioredoxin domain-containing protein n=2 Tax=Micromonospora eburnea TaxID=227316 RepID=A0A1C6UYG4_9ACTN|nr:hypothetical protein GA0070604_3974 [Micromonospora eburnea]
MDVEVLVVPDCPHAETTTAVVRRALDDLGLCRTRVTTTVVATQAQAEQLGFVGSPTVMIDGRDPFADPAMASGLACRLYPGDTGLTGTPPIQQVRQALQRASTTG